MQEGRPAKEGAQKPEEKPESTPEKMKKTLDTIRGLF